MRKQFKYLKYFIALVVTIGSVYQASGKTRRFTDCYNQNIQLTNADGTVTAILVVGELSTAAQADVFFAPYLRQSVWSAIDPFQCPGNHLFCCATFELTTDVRVPLVTVSGVLGRWKVANLYFYN